VNITPVITTAIQEFIYKYILTGIFGMSLLKVGFYVSLKQGTLAQRFDFYIDQALKNAIPWLKIDE